DRLVSFVRILRGNREHTGYCRPFPIPGILQRQEPARHTKGNRFREGEGIDGKGGIEKRRRVRMDGDTERAHVTHEFRHLSPAPLRYLRHRLEVLQPLRSHFLDEPPILLSVCLTDERLLVRKAIDL